MNDSNIQYIGKARNMSREIKARTQPVGSNITYMIKVMFYNDAITQTNISFRADFQTSNAKTFMA